MSFFIKVIIDDITENATAGKVSKNDLTKYIILFSAMVVINLIIALCEARNTLAVNRISLRIRSSLVSLIMKKMLSYPVTNPNEFTEGKILNFVTIDANKFELCALFIMWLFSNLFMIFLTTCAIGYLAGLVCLPVVFALLLGSAFIYFMNSHWNKLKTDMM